MIVVAVRLVAYFLRNDPIYLNPQRKPWAQMGGEHTYTQTKYYEKISFSKIVLTVFVPTLRCEPLRCMAHIACVKLRFLSLCVINTDMITTQMTKTNTNDTLL
jgi:hypothetical protein